MNFTKTSKNVKTTQICTKQSDNIFILKGFSHKAFSKPFYKIGFTEKPSKIVQ